MEHTNNILPLFNENNYALWKGRMEVYLLAQGYEVRDTVQNGFTSTTDEQGRKNLVNDAKKKILLSVDLLNLLIIRCWVVKPPKMYGISLRIYMQVTQI